LGLTVADVCAITVVPSQDYMSSCDGLRRAGDPARGLAGFRLVPGGPPRATSPRAAAAWTYQWLRREWWSSQRRRREPRPMNSNAIAIQISGNRKNP